MVRVRFVILLVFKLLVRVQHLPQLEPFNIMEGFLVSLGFDQREKPDQLGIEIGSFDTKKLILARV